MATRYDQITIGNFAMKFQAALVGDDDDGDCEFDSPPTIVEFGTDSRLFWEIDFQPEAIVPYVHKCPDGRQLNCFQVTITAVISTSVFVEYDRNRRSKVLKICPCDCTDETGGVTQVTAGRTLAVGKRPGAELLPFRSQQ
jgi:hypothetical protein